MGPGPAAALGVDLGTTWTGAALCPPGGEAEVLVLGEAGPAMPSVVAFDGDTPLAGDTAERRVLEEPTSGAREPKRRLGDTTPYVIAGTPYGADTLMGHLLRHVLEVATAQGGAPPDVVVLTHPANWGEYKLDLLREAGRVAGVEGVALLSEPEAAAQHYVHLGRVHSGDAVAVYDFGGGTFDVAVVRCGESGSEVLGTPQGLERLGGLDLDEAVLAHVNTSVDGRLAAIDPADASFRRAFAQLRLDCTRAKETLSVDSETSVRVSLPDLVTEVRITREEFEAAVRPRLADTLGAFDRAVASAGLTAGDLAGILLVGGSSRIPLVAELVTQHTGRPVLVDADAKLVVALGAAGSVATPASGGAITEETAMADKADSDETKGSGAGGDGAKKAPAKRTPAKRTVGGRAVDVGRVAAGAAGVAAAGAAAVGVAASGVLDDDGDDAAAASVAADAPPAPVAPADDSMDEFDDVAGSGGGTTAFAGGGGAGGGGARVGGGGGGGGFAQAGTATAPPPAAPAPAPAGAPDLDAIRAELHQRLEHWTPPAGADAAEVAQLRTDLGHLIDNYQPIPGQSLDTAVAGLQSQFEDKVHDFTQDQKIDALVEEQERERAQAQVSGATTGTTPSATADPTATTGPAATTSTTSTTGTVDPTSTPTTGAVDPTATAGTAGTTGATDSGTTPSSGLDQPAPADVETVAAGAAAATPTQMSDAGNTGIAGEAPGVMTAPGPAADPAHAALADEFDQVATMSSDAGGAGAGAPADVGMIADPAPAQAQSPLSLEDDVLGTSQVAQAPDAVSDQAVTMTAGDLGTDGGQDDQFMTQSEYEQQAADIPGSSEPIVFGTESEDWGSDFSVDDDTSSSTDDSAPDLL
jgi:actin-like ATPase involved in cell morphogenesis